METLYQGHREFNTTVPRQTIKNGRPGRPWVDIPSEVLEDFNTRARLHVGKDSARIFRVSRGTIMHRVRLFDLEHLSLSSTRTDEAIDSIIHDFVSRHGSTTGETYEDT